ncbi:MAG: hypothetical protein Aurels2KO_16810 [Aureliella sp.]
MFTKVFPSLVIVALLGPTLHAQNNAPENNAPRSSSQTPSDRSQTKSAPTSNRNHDNAKPTIDVDEFVAKHLPELTKLLERLKKQGKGQYQRAARDLERSIARIENLKTRDEQLHSVELDLWKTRSRLQFAAAEIAIKQPENDDTATKRIQKLLKKKTELELDRLRILRERAVKQIAELDSQITEREKDLKDEDTIKKLAEQYKRRYRAKRKN